MKGRAKLGEDRKMLGGRERKRSVEAKKKSRPRRVSAFGSPGHHQPYDSLESCESGFLPSLLSHPAPEKK